jgi:methionyl-tRNA formyltransferase
VVKLIDMKILFIGTDKFAVPILKKLLSHRKYNIVGVITQPDRPVGRKQTVSPAPVKQFLLEIGQNLKIFQPEKIKIEAEEILDKTKPELILVVAYGQMIPKVMLDYPKYKCLNIHASLLPKYRGAVPVEAALLNGDTKTGVSILQMSPGLDDGPVLAEKEISIKEQDDSISLREKLSKIGTDLLIELLPKWIKGEIDAKSQEDIAKQTKRTMSLCRTSNFSREKAEIKFNDSIELAFNKIRAFANGTGAWINIDHNHKKRDLKILKARIVDKNLADQNVGKISYKNENLLLQLENGVLSLLQVQLAGKKIGDAKDYRFLGNH